MGMQGVRRYLRTSAGDARLTASQSLKIASKRRLQPGKNFIEKGESTPQVPSFLPFSRQPTNNLLSSSNPSRSRELQIPYVRLHTRTCVLFSSFPSRKTPQKKFENSRKKDQITIPKRKKEKKPTKPFPPGSSPANLSQTSQDAEPVVFFFDQLKLCDLPIPNPTDSHITRSAFDLPGLLCLQSSSPFGQPRALPVARSHFVKSLLRCVHPC